MSRPSITRVERLAARVAADITGTAATITALETLTAELGAAVATLEGPR
jgi:hypothetical protein